MNIDITIADSAVAKMATGSLMTLGEVAARLAVSPMTVHRLPLTSIRLGRSLRFAPHDVAQLIAASREETIVPMPSQISEPIDSGNRLCTPRETLAENNLLKQTRSHSSTAAVEAARAMATPPMPPAIPASDRPGNRLCSVDDSLTHKTS